MVASYSALKKETINMCKYFKKTTKNFKRNIAGHSNIGFEIFG